MKYQLIKGLPEDFIIYKNLPKMNKIYKSFTSMYWDAKEYYCLEYYGQAAIRFYRAYQEWFSRRGICTDSIRAALYGFQAILNLLPDKYEEGLELFHIINFCEDKVHLLENREIKLRERFLDEIY